MEQRTEEWVSARLGKVTASKISDVMSKGRGDAPSLTRKKYMDKLLAERLTGIVQGGFSSNSIQHGIDTETEARSVYGFLSDSEVSEVGFINHSSIDMSGASPDGLVGEDGLVEIKCPDSHTHLNFIETHKVKREYFLQMQWQMACTGRLWCDFISFDPRFPANIQIEVLRIERDKTMIKDMEKEVLGFLEEITAREAYLKMEIM